MNKRDFDLHDQDGYPTDTALEMIKSWDVFKHKEEFIQFLYDIWHWDNMIESTGDSLKLHTGGWSGNEDVIGALQENTMFWMFAWEWSKRGGHYKFDLSRIRDMKAL